MQYPTKIVGNAAKVQYRNVSAAPCRLVGFVGHNGFDADVYIQAHAAQYADLEGDEVPILSVLAFKGLPFTFSLPAAVGFDKLVIVPSSAVEKLTLAVGELMTVQAILAA